MPIKSIALNNKADKKPKALGNEVHDKQTLESMFAKKIMIVPTTTESE
jgi:hypothetical protein